MIRIVAELHFQTCRTPVHLYSRTQHIICAKLAPWCRSTLSMKKHSAAVLIVSMEMAVNLADSKNEKMLNENAADERGRRRTRISGAKFSGNGRQEMHEFA